MWWPLELEIEDSSAQAEPELEEHASVQELMVFVKGPDFPTGGLIVGMEGIIQAYSTGKGPDCDARSGGDSGDGQRWAVTDRD